MRKLYLIRHGKPDVGDNERLCLGVTDIGLGDEGKQQGMMLRERMKTYSISQVFCSKLLRSIETAKYLSEQPIIIEGLEEQNQGLWDGFSFTEIKKRWPQLYEERGINKELLPPGAEPIEDAQKRFYDAVSQAMTMVKGDVAIVAHKSVIQSFLCLIHKENIVKRHSYSIPYGSVTVVDWKED